MKRKSTKRILVLVLASWLASHLSSSAAIRFVDPAATGIANGSSWENAFRSLARGIANAGAGDELWVVGGVYYPEDLASGQESLGPRARSFAIKLSLSIYGGFAGGETMRSQRDWNANPTVLSGELGDPGSKADNAFTVLHNTAFATAFSIDGVTIRGGNSDGAAGTFAGDGGGAFVSGTAATFANCTFFNNSAKNGGGLAHGGGRLTLLNCAFITNHADSAGGAINSKARFNELSHCTFASSSTFGQAAAISVQGPAAGLTTIGNCVFDSSPPLSSAGIEVSGMKNFINNVAPEEIGGIGTLIALVIFTTAPPADGSSEGDVSLRASSPGIGHGSSAGVWADLTDMDGDGDHSEPLPLSLNGNERPRDRPDAGAYELVNLPPTSLDLSGQQIIENVPSGGHIGTFSTADPNFAEFTYQFVAGDGDDDNGSFSLNGNSLESAEVFDFETKPSYTIRVRATEVPGGSDDSIESQFEIRITDATDQLLTIDAPQAIAYEPRGGIAPGNPHVGRIRASRSGEIDQPLEVSVAVEGRPTPGDFRIEPSLGTSFQFGSGQSVAEFEIIPYLDSQADETDTITITLEESPIDYQVVDPSATVTIVEGPLEAHYLANDLALPPAEDDDSNANRVPDLLEYTLADTVSPAGFARPEYSISENLVSEIIQSITLAVSRSSRDVQIAVEESDDLRDWRESTPSRRIVATSPSHQSYQIDLEPTRSPRAFVRLRVSHSDRPPGFSIQSPAISMVGIPAGHLMMGSPTSELGRSDNEGPLTNVQITQPFWIGATEITQGQYLVLAAENPSANPGEDLPVERVNHAEAAAFCALLDERERAAGNVPEGYVYRLPTEAEWEHACRARTVGSTYFTGRLEDNAWFSVNSLLVTHRVGQKQANAWGLFDTYGNVSEWCSDVYSPMYPGGIVSDPIGNGASDTVSVRGGHIALGEPHQRSAFRLPSEADTRSPVVGFRIVLGPRNDP